MKTRGPLAGRKTLPMQRFRTIGLERQMRTALGPTGTRKTAQSSLKIESLRRTRFRAHVSAAPLKQTTTHDHSAVWRTEFPRSRERGPIEAR